MLKLSVELLFLKLNHQYLTESVGSDVVQLLRFSLFHIACMQIFMMKNCSISHCYMDVIPEKGRLILCCSDCIQDGV